MFIVYSCLCSSTKTRFIVVLFDVVVLLMFLFLCLFLKTKHTCLFLPWSASAAAICGAVAPAALEAVLRVSLGVATV